MRLLVPRDELPMFYHQLESENSILTSVHLYSNDAQYLVDCNSLVIRLYAVMRLHHGTSGFVVVDERDDHVHV